MSWIETFFTQRTQVTVDGKPPTSHMWPPGSDKEQYLKCYSWCLSMTCLNQVSKICLYADDSVPYKHIRDRNDCTIMKCELESFVIWENRSQMTFHPPKYKVMHFNRSRKPIITTQCMLGQNFQETVSQATYLAVELADKRTCTPHINQVKG